MIDIIMPSAGKTTLLRKLTAISMESIVDSEKIMRTVPCIVETKNYKETHGSVINGIALNEGFSKSNSEYVFVCHNDIIMCRNNVLSEMASLLETECGLVGFFYRNMFNRGNMLHSAGFMFKRNEYLDCSFDNSFTPRIEPGDRHTPYCKSVLRKKIHIYQNTFNNDEIVSTLVLKYPYLKNLRGEKAIDKEGNLIWIHVGRGSSKPERIPGIIELSKIMKGKEPDYSILKCITK